MSELKNISNNLTSAEDQSAWGDLVICRVEVDLPNWLSQPAGGNNWQVYSESEYDHFAINHKRSRNEAGVLVCFK